MAELPNIIMKDDLSSWGDDYAMITPCALPLHKFMQFSPPPQPEIVGHYILHAIKHMAHLNVEFVWRDAKLEHVLIPLQLGEDGRFERVERSVILTGLVGLEKQKERFDRMVVPDRGSQHYFCFGRCMQSLFSYLLDNADDITARGPDLRDGWYTAATPPYKLGKLEVDDTADTFALGLSIRRALHPESIESVLQIIKPLDALKRLVDIKTVTINDLDGLSDKIKDFMATIREFNLGYTYLGMLTPEQITRCGSVLELLLFAGSPKCTALMPIGSTSIPHEDLPSWREALLALIKKDEEEEGGDEN